MFHDIPATSTARQIKSRQKRFVRELVKRIEKEIIRKIDETKNVPLEWDGLQLRAYVAHRAKEADGYLDRYERRKVNQVIRDRYL